MQKRSQKHYLFWFVLRSSKGLIRNAIASSIKVLIGRAAYFQPHERFLIDYVAFKLGLRNEITLTASSLPEEGAGSQARLRMLAISLSRWLNIGYVHTPFAQIGRNELSLEAWDAAWEHHFNLGVGEQLALEDGQQHPPSKNSKFYDIARDYNIINYFGAERALKLCGIYSEQFKQKYYSNKIRSAGRAIRVAVHVRRGHDVPKENERWTKNSATSKAVLHVKRVLEEAKLEYSLKLFSEGDKNDFSLFEKMGMEIFVNGDAIKVMQEMIAADILIMGKGFFSYISGIIADGVVLYDPWGGNPALRNWITRSPEGDFDEDLFRSELAKIIARKRKVT